MSKISHLTPCCHETRDEFTLHAKESLYGYIMTALRLTHLSAGGLLFVVGIHDKPITTPQTFW